MFGFFFVRNAKFNEICGVLNVIPSSLCMALVSGDPFLLAHLFGLEVTNNSEMSACKSLCSAHCFSDGWILDGAHTYFARLSQDKVSPFSPRLAWPWLPVLGLG